MSLKHDELPLPDYDHLPVGGLASHLHPLDAAAVEQLLDYEREHGNRLPVTEVLEHRLDALRNGAEPSGTLSGSMPEVVQNQRGSKVSEVTTGPTINPPSHGDPTNPAQPR